MRSSNANGVSWDESQDLKKSKKFTCDTILLYSIFEKIQKYIPKHLV